MYLIYYLFIFYKINVTNLSQNRINEKCSCVSIEGGPTHRA